MKVAKFLVALLVLWLPFSVLSVVAIPVALWALATGEWDYAKNILRAMDCTAAALFGRSGRYTVSAECGARKGCVLCGLLCRFLDLIQKGHCEGAAKREGIEWNR